MNNSIIWMNPIIFWYFWFWTNRTNWVRILLIFHNQTFGNNKHKAAALAAILKSQTEECGVVQCSSVMYISTLYTNTMYNLQYNVNLNLNLYSNHQTTFHIYYINKRLYPKIYMFLLFIEIRHWELIIFVFYVFILIYKQMTDILYYLAYYL